MIFPFMRQASAFLHDLRICRLQRFHVWLGVLVKVIRLDAVCLGHLFDEYNVFWSSCKISKSFTTLYKAELVVF